MSSKKKHRKGTLRKTLTYGIVIAAFILACFIIYASLKPSDKTPGDHKAAIVDHLSASQPNQTFWQTSKSILKTAGFKVHYYASIGVDVGFYRDLPTHGFDFIILRVHSAIVEGSDFVCLFSSEPYDDNKARTTYLLDILNDRLVKAMMYEGAPEYFGITPLFVKGSMKGEFDDAVVIMMGCDGLTHTTMAEAFREKGAKVYIAWNGPVSAHHTDQATTNLLQHLITEKQTIKKAVTETMKEVGPDPTYKSILLLYPDTPEARSYIIPHITINIALNVAEIRMKILKRKISSQSVFRSIIINPFPIYPRAQHWRTLTEKRGKVSFFASLRV